MKRLVYTGGSFNPMTLAHLFIAKRLKMWADRVLVVPCGNRPDKATTNDVNPVHRAAIADLTLADEIDDRLAIDYRDLDNETFTRNHEVQMRYEREYDVWHMVGGDLIKGGARGESEIQTKWMEGQKLWNKLQFAVFVRPGVEFDSNDLPPRRKVFNLPEQYDLSSSMVRERVYSRQPITGLVHPDAEGYISRHGMYTGLTPSSTYQLKLDSPRLKVVRGASLNPEVDDVVQKLKPITVEEDPNLVVVLGGDGTLLRAARKHWNLRIPILGLNYGNVGYNLNDVRKDFSLAMFKRSLKVFVYPMLTVEMTAPDGSKTEHLAFNDAWVCADSREGAPAWMTVYVDGEMRLPNVVGDGMLVATPQGSTGYAKSMGAVPLRSDKTDELLLVGNNIYNSRWRGQSKLSLRSQVKVVNASPASHRKLYGLVDSVSVGEVVEMRVRASGRAAVELAFFQGQDPLTKYDAMQFGS